MIDTKELRRLAKDQEWIGRWYDAGCETLMAERNGEHEEVAHPIPIGLVPYLIAVQPASIVEMIDRLEAAEKERDAYKSAYANWTAKTEWLQDEINSGKLPAKYLGMHRADGIKVEIDALRAKIEAMEKQEPVAWARKLAIGLPSFGCVTDLKYRPSNIPESSYIPLYALPGAQPAPSISPAALRPVIQWLRNGCDPVRAADELEMLAAAPEAKP